MNLTVFNLDNHPTKPYAEFVDLQRDFKTYSNIPKLAERIRRVGFKARAQMRPIRQAFRRLANQTVRARRFEVSPLMPVFSWVSKTWRYMDYSDELFGKVTTATSYELHCDFSFQTPPEDCPIYFAARQGDKKWQKRFAAIDYTINKKGAAFVSPQMGAQKKLADAKALAEADVRQRLAAVFLCQQIYT